MERVSGRVSAEGDAFERLARRRTRRERNRRLTAGVLALAIALGGSYAAFQALRGSEPGGVVGAGGTETISALWPEQTAEALAATQASIDAGDPDVAWRTDPQQVAERFALDALQWTSVSATLGPDLDPDVNDVVSYDLAPSLPVPCPTPLDAVSTLWPCPPRVTISLERLGTGEGLWTVTQVSDETLLMPYVPGDEVVPGEPVSISTTLAEGTRVAVGVAFLTSCGESGAEETVVVQGGELRLLAPPFSAAECPGYVYAMLPRTPGGAVAVGSFLFTDAQAVPTIGYSVDALSAVPVRFVNAGPTDVAVLTCDDSGTISPARSVVVAQPDGVHVRVVNAADRPIAFTIGDRFGASLDPGASSEAAYPFPPMPLLSVSCSVVSDGGSGTASSSAIAIQDPESYYVPAELECGTADVVAWDADFAPDATGPADPVEAATPHLDVREGDVVEPAGYLEAEERLVRQVRDGKVIAVVSLMSDGQGGWLATSGSACSVDA